MSEAGKIFPNPEDLVRLKLLWQEAATPVLKPDTPAKALGAGVNFRINLLKALQAAWETTEFAIKAVALGHAPFNIVSWYETGAAAVGAVKSIFASLVQELSKIEYIYCVILSKHTEGLTREQLKGNISKFLDTFDPSGEREFDWYLGITPQLVREANEARNEQSWFDDVTEALKEKDFVTDEDGLLTFTPVNFTIGWKRS